MNVNTKFIFLLIFIFIGIILLGYTIHKFGNFNPDEFGLGENTTSVINHSDTSALNAFPDDESLHQFKKLSSYITTDTATYTCIWFGASQLHAINRYTKGEKLAYFEADSMNKKNGIRHYQFSSPNANLHDILAMLLFVLNKGARPDIVIIPFVYDDLREYPVQDRLLYGIEKEDLIQKCSYSEKHFLIQFDNLNKCKNKASIQRNAVDNTPQIAFENKIVRTIGKLYPDFLKKNNVISCFQSLYYTASGNIFGKVYSTVYSSAKTTRYPTIPDSLKAWNLLALEDIARIARENKMKILFYRQPIRPTNQEFYHEQPAYDNFYYCLTNKFKQDSSLLFFADLQGIVPQKYWGTTNLKQPDVFHFTAAGHKILGDTISKLTFNILSKNAVQ